MRWLVLTNNVSHHVGFDNLLDIAPANDVVRRGPLRALSRWALRAAVNMESEDNLYAGLSYDVSAGGIFVATFDTPPIGARVDLVLTLPDGLELALSGVVRWVREAQLASDGLPAGCGIEWDELPDGALLAFLRFAKAREPLLWESETT
ncbi:MAG: Signal recognition particle receptor protein FtsY [Myxococcales bacterium]|nr:Signal recognition particle receptor protein FtsY [Myxococcales bacterium]